MDKFTHMIDYLSNVDNPETTIVLFIDGFDTKIVGDPQEAVARFQREFRGCRVLLSVGTRRTCSIF